MGGLTDAVQDIGAVQLNIQYYMGMAVMVIAGAFLIYFMFFYKNNTDNIIDNGKKEKLSKTGGMMAGGAFAFIGFLMYISASLTKNNKTFQTISGADTVAQGVANIFDDTK